MKYVVAHCFGLIYYVLEVGWGVVSYSQDTESLSA